MATWYSFSVMAGVSHNPLPASLIYSDWEFLQHRIDGGISFPSPAMDPSPVRSQYLQLDDRFRLIDELTIRSDVVIANFDFLPVLYNQRAVPFSWNYLKSEGTGSYLGISTGLTFHHGSRIQADIDYTYSESKGSEAAITPAQSIGWKNTSVPVTEVATSFDRSHVIQGAVLAKGLLGEESSEGPTRGVLSNLDLAAHLTHLLKSTMR